ncbi:hypothetical protein MYX78_06115 [Acidobacteria bacterium AH-259-G07]|nr:hypothetical protein [Acidobacteria bacterium AH-259-G07]
MPAAERYIDFPALVYIVAAFPTCSFFLVRYDHAPIGVTGSHSFAYCIFSALLLLETWRLAGWEEGPIGIYKRYPHVRRLVAAISFPAAIALAIVGLHKMIEGRVPGDGPFWFLFTVLLMVSVFAGFVCVREHPLSEYSQRQLAQARRILKFSWSALGGIVLLIGGSGLISDLVRSFLSEIIENLHLILASIVLVISIVITFGIQPWLIVRQIEQKLE